MVHPYIACRKMPSRDEIYDERQIIINWLDGFTDIEVVLQNVCSPDEYVLLCNKLTNTLETINKYVVRLYDNYKSNGVIQLEELSRVIISASITQLKICSSLIHSFYLAKQCKEATANLEEYINTTSGNLQKTWLWLCYDIVDDAAVMARYGQNMLNEYRLGAFMAHRDAMPGYFMPYTKTSSLTNAKMNARGKIMAFFDEVIDTDTDKIVLEALGRYLWNMRTKLDNDNPENSILFWIMVYEHYMSRLGRKSIYSDVNKSDARTISDGEKLRMAKESLKPIKNAIINNCRTYFASDEQREAVVCMFDKMLQCNCREHVLKKLEKSSCVKFAHEIAGLLYNNKVFKNCRPGDIVKTMGMATDTYSKPSADSCKHYVNKPDLPPDLKTWILAEIAVGKNKKSR